MTTKERLHELVDELSEPEADDALRLIEARRSEEWLAQKPERIELTAEGADALGDALEHPERSEPGLRRLAASAAKFRRA